MLLGLKLQAQNIPVVKAKNVCMYIGKEIIVVGKLSTYGNSSYLQSAWFYLGKDTLHQQLKVVVQGKYYGIGRTWIGSYVGKEVQIKGFVRKNQDVYLEATDSIMYISPLTL